MRPDFETVGWPLRSQPPLCSGLLQEALRRDAAALRRLSCLLFFILFLIRLCFFFIYRQVYHRYGPALRALRWLGRLEGGHRCRAVLVFIFIFFYLFIFIYLFFILYLYKDIKTKTNFGALCAPNRLENPYFAAKASSFGLEINIFLPKVKKGPKKVLFWPFFSPLKPGTVPGGLQAARPGLLL